MSVARDLIDGFRQAGAGLGDALALLEAPRLRIGVTGLARAGKTVFLTALTHALVSGGRLAAFEAAADGRVRSARLAAQPDDAVPRFAYEDHLAMLTGPARAWPSSTRRIAELRIEIDYQSAKGWLGGLIRPGVSRLTLDLVDYPGEWLLDLPLMEKSYRGWSSETLDAAARGARKAPFAVFLDRLAAVDPTAPAEESVAQDLAQRFTAALAACRADGLSSLPPGRFLMPGDLEGSPALTFAPLRVGEGAPSPLARMMERRFEAYKSHVVQPFFREHFSRLDRQIVLVDVLSALNEGTAALADLELALAEVLAAFRIGANSWLSDLFAPRIDRVLFAATKADHLHHQNHDRLEAILSVLMRRAMARVRGQGARMEVAAVAAVRATREVTAKLDGETLLCIAGVPLAGERLDGAIYDGKREVALFPGDLPERPEAVFADGAPTLRFLRFMPPQPERGGEGSVVLPHIRLDKALQFLLGDKLA